MPWSIQETMLPGFSVRERFEAAQRLGLQGVEVLARDLTPRIGEIIEAMVSTGVRVSAVNLEGFDGYLAADRDERDAASERLRQAMTDAVDLAAENVIFVPHYGAPRVPDLMPLHSPEEIQWELMIWLLRVVSDLGTALGVTLHMQPRHRYDTQFLTTLEQAGRLCEAVKEHPAVKICASTFDMALQEAQPFRALAAQGARIGMLHLADHQGGLPGTGYLPFAELGAALREIHYAGWQTLAVRPTPRDANQRYALYDGVAASLDQLRAAGVGEGME